jgi:hypothetical protein
MSDKPAGPDKDRSWNSLAPIVVLEASSCAQVELVADRPEHAEVNDDVLLECALAFEELKIN